MTYPENDADTFGEPAPLADLLLIWALKGTAVAAIAAVVYLVM